MADMMFTRTSYLNPDDDFVLHGRSTAYWYILPEVIYVEE